MKSSSPIRQGQEFWENHILEAESFPGSVLAYCKQAGLASQTFYRWRSRIKKKMPFSKKPLAKSSFLPVKIKNPQSLPKKSKLPDPKWVAEFILSLHQRLDDEVTFRV